MPNFCRYCRHDRLKCIVVLVIHVAPQVVVDYAADLECKGGLNLVGELAIPGFAVGDDDLLIKTASVSLDQSPNPTCPLFEPDVALADIHLAHCSELYLPPLNLAVLIADCDLPQAV